VHFVSQFLYDFVTLIFDLENVTREEGNIFSVATGLGHRNTVESKKDSDC